MASVWAAASSLQVSMASRTTCLFQRPPEVHRLKSELMAVPQTSVGTILRPNLCSSSCSQAGDAPA